MLDAGTTKVELSCFIGLLVRGAARSRQQTKKEKAEHSVAPGILLAGSDHMQIAVPLNEPLTTTSLLLVLSQE